MSRGVKTMSLADLGMNLRRGMFRDPGAARWDIQHYQVEGHADSKTLAQVARDSSRDSVQPNLGRVQQANAHRYSRIMRLPAFLIYGHVHATPTPAVLEQFQGFVTKVEGDSAYVTLETAQGERVSGVYPAAELAANGVGERDRFSLATVDQGSSVRFDIRLIPRRVVSSEEQRAIQERIERTLDGYTPGDDY